MEEMKRGENEENKKEKTVGKFTQLCYNEKRSETILIYWRTRMDKTQKELFLYNDVGERSKRMNRFYLPTSYLLWFLFFVYLWMKWTQQSTQDISLGYVIFNSVLLVVFSVANLFFYKAQKSGYLLCFAVLIETAIEVAVIGLKTDADFIFYPLLIVLALLLPYYLTKLFRWFAIFYSVLSLGIAVARMALHPELACVDDFIKVLCVLAVIFVMTKISGIMKQFNDHAVGATEAQAEKQRVILDGIVSVSQAVAEESAKSTGVIEQLVEAAQAVDSSMREISDATGTTAQSIEEQNAMTQSIRDAITDTRERSGRMVHAATESNEGIQTNIRLMEELKEQSVLIADTNRDVSVAMTALSDKTKDMEAIVGMILKISEQTNLLSLNASIESARAGEAGRGFAVVADQIRQLAVQTKESTEEIATIINALNENANEVMNSVSSSVEATTEQGNKILAAADTFGALQENMTRLIADVNEIDRQILGLTDSNNKIVENIVQLSATTEEVAAGADQVQAVSAKNMDYAEQVKAAIDVIREKTDGLKNYL